MSIFSLFPRFWYTFWYNLYDGGWIICWKFFKSIFKAFCALVKCHIGFIAFCAFVKCHIGFIADNVSWNHFQTQKTLTESILLFLVTKDITVKRRILLHTRQLLFLLHLLVDSVVIMSWLMWSDKLCPGDWFLLVGSHKFYRLFE